MTAVAEEDASVAPLMVQVLEANAGDAEALEEVSLVYLFLNDFILTISKLYIFVY